MKTYSLIILTVYAYAVYGYECGQLTKDVNSPILTKTNFRRHQNSAPDVSLNDTLIENAQRWASLLAEMNGFGHSHTPGVGENIYYFWSSQRHPDTSGGDFGAVYAWYQEAACYQGYYDPSANIGHFTQLVWVSTRTIGCGSCRGSDGWYRIVCQYYPYGNDISNNGALYPQNVHQPYGKNATVPAPENGCSR